MSAKKTRTGLDWIANPGLANIGPVSYPSGLAVNRFENILVDRLREVDELARLAIKLLQDAVLADREE